jgi:hypothetical protein
MRVPPETKVAICEVSEEGLLCNIVLNTNTIKQINDTCLGRLRLQDVDIVIASIPDGYHIGKY